MISLTGAGQRGLFQNLLSVSCEHAMMNDEVYSMAAAHDHNYHTACVC